MARLSHYSLPVAAAAAAGYDVMILQRCATACFWVMLMLMLSVDVSSCGQYKTRFDSTGTAMRGRFVM